MSYVLRAAFVALVLAGCAGDEWPTPTPVSFAELAQEHQEWRENRRERLVRPFSGVVLWMGLWELAQGATPFGSDPGLPIVLPEEDSPRLAGTIHRSRAGDPARAECRLSAHDPRGRSGHGDEGAAKRPLG